MKKKRKKKGEFIKILEYAAVYVLILISRALPLKFVKIISNFLGDLLYLLVPRRRNIAIENLRNAFRDKKNEKEIKEIARQSCRSFFLTFLEVIKLRFLLTETGAINNLGASSEDLIECFRKAKEIHDKSGGCIFVTPHIGNWEILPHVSASVGIPLTVVVRPLDNNYLEKLIYSNRAASGQVIIPKKNALAALQKTLRQGKSIGMLPDQSTMKGISVNFFGRKATTTPVPAILAITYKRPIVVIACCRKSGNYQYEGFVCNPIWPEEFKSEKTEIFRLTEEMNRTMESIIQKYPEQYLWIHNRWKTYKDKREILS
jgi:KDO2-lipid IV(A) lauroyltransferase